LEPKAQPIIMSPPQVEILRRTSTRGIISMNWGMGGVQACFATPKRRGRRHKPVAVTSGSAHERVMPTASASHRLKARVKISFLIQFFPCPLLSRASYHTRTRPECKRTESPLMERAPGQMPIAQGKPPGDPGGFPAVLQGDLPIRSGVSHNHRQVQLACTLVAFRATSRFLRSPHDQG
jgi:hypothetical protein